MRIPPYLVCILSMNLLICTLLRTRKLCKATLPEDSQSQKADNVLPDWLSTSSPVRLNVVSVFSSFAGQRSPAITRDLSSFLLDQLSPS